jgi:hypothetical protein
VEIVAFAKTLGKTTKIFKRKLFLNMAPCNAVEVHRLFGGIYCLHLQRRKNKLEIEKKPISRSLAWLTLHHKDGGSTFLRNVGVLLLVY